MIRDSKSHSFRFGKIQTVTGIVTVPAIGNIAPWAARFTLANSVELKLARLQFSWPALQSARFCARSDDWVNASIGQRLRHAAQRHFRRLTFILVRPSDVNYIDGKARYLKIVRC